MINSTAADFLYASTKLTLSDIYVFDISTVHYENEFNTHHYFPALLNQGIVIVGAESLKQPTKDVNWVKEGF